jgi:thioredoxin reductase
MNCQVDIIIIGDSKEGHEAVKKIASAKPTIKIVFVSREFKKSTTHDYLNVEYIKEEVTFLDYRNRLFSCYLKNGDRIYGTHLIVASGLNYTPLMLNNKRIPCVFNNTEDIPKVAKNQQAIVLGKNDADIKFAIAVAKKFKYVYFCMESLTPNITDKNIQKLINIENIVVLPNTAIAKFTIADNALSSVELNNYSTLTCSAIFVKTKATPDTTFVSNKLVSKDEAGYIKTTNSSQSLLVPKCFAIGSCTCKSTKKMRDLMIENILTDFGGN